METFIKRDQNFLVLSADVIVRFRDFRLVIFHVQSVGAIFDSAAPVFFFIINLVLNIHEISVGRRRFLQFDSVYSML